MKSEERIVQIISAARKSFGVRTGELRSNPGFSDVVHLPDIVIRTDELPKVLVIGIAATFQIPRNVLETQSAILTGDTTQQNTYQFDKMMRQWKSLMACANEDLPGVRRAMVSLSMIVKHMGMEGFMKTEYHV